MTSFLKRLGTILLGIGWAGGCFVDDPAVVAQARGAANGDSPSGSVTQPDGAPPLVDASVPLEGAIADSTLQSPVGPPDSSGDVGTPSWVSDPSLPSEPGVPPACATLDASRSSTNGVLWDESNPDTGRIQAAIDACPSGRSVVLHSASQKDAFLSGPLRLASGVTLSIEKGTTLFASRTPRDFDTSSGKCGTDANDSSDGCKPLISVSVANAAVMGDGVIDGRGGEPMTGDTKTWWDVALDAKTKGLRYSAPSLVRVVGGQNFVLHHIALHNAPKFHAVIASQGFTVWGVSIISPSLSVNSAGRLLSPNYAVGTDGIEVAGAAGGLIAYSKISVGGDHVGIKGNSRGASQGITIAHNRFGAGQGMAIGSETYSGVSDVTIRDLSIDGNVYDGGMLPSDRNGIRVSSDPTVGGLVTGVSYADVCVRNLDNPIKVDPHPMATSGTSTPNFAGIRISDFHAVAGAVAPQVTLFGYSASSPLGITLDNVVVEGISSANIYSANANVTLGPRGVNFNPVGNGVTVNNQATGAISPNTCAGKWVSF